MEYEALRKMLEDIVQRERDDGCCMADESLIDPAIRRWRSYDRRHHRSKIQSFEARVKDLKKGLLLLFPNHNYDESCLQHLAESFGEVFIGKAATNRHH